MVTLSTSELTLGEDPHVEVRVSTGDPSELATAVSAGTLTLHTVGPDGAVYHWQPPEIRHPTVAVLAFWERTAARPDVAVARVALKGRTVLEMDTDRGASVMVQVSGERFGPVTADDTGRVRVPIVVPPGARKAQAIATSRGRETSRTVPLEIPTTRPFAFAAGPETLPESGGWAQVIQGDPANEGIVALISDEAEVTFVEASGGAATFRIVPRAEAGASVHLRAQVQGADEPQTLSLARASTQEPPPANEPPPAPPAPEGWSVSPWVLVGGFHAGGANVGPGAELGVTLQPPWRVRALFIDASVGVRRLGFTDDRNVLGPVSSELWVVPIDIAARYQIFERGAFGLSARAGAGILPFTHTVSGPFLATGNQAGLGVELFGAAEAQYRVGRFAALLQLRGAFASIQTQRVQAVPGGGMALVGAQWRLP